MRKLGLVCGAVAVVALATFPFGDFQNHPHWERVRLMPHAFHPLNHVVDVVGNLLLGAPAGMVVALSYRASPMAAAVAVAPVSLLGEWTQVYSHSRYPTGSDVVLNVLGAVLAARFATSPRRRSPRREVTAASVTEV